MDGLREMSMLIRTDGNTEIGTGHVMRCLTLGLKWREVTGGDVRCVSAASSPPVERMLVENGIAVARLEGVAPGGSGDIRGTVGLVEETRPRIVVLDGYRFGGDFQSALRETGAVTLFIDDFVHADWYRAEYVLNQNVYARSDMYERRDPETRLLLGTRYALLRPEFREYRAKRGDVPERAGSILVTLGGGDPDNFTLKVMEALKRVPRSLSVTVVAGSANPHIDALNDAAGDMDGWRVLRGVRNMAELMAGADMAVSAGGTTSWELLCLGVPTVMLIIADNQRMTVEHLGRTGVAVNAGSARSVGVDELAEKIAALADDGRRRAEMRRRAMAMVDGDGAGRVVEVLAKHR